VRLCQWFQDVGNNKLCTLSCNKKSDLYSFAFYRFPLSAGAFPPEHYVGVNFNSNSSTKLVSYVFVNLTGMAVNVSRENCSSSGKFEDAADSTDVRRATPVAAEKGLMS
jgi:hypothetical protein